MSDCVLFVNYSGMIYNLNEESDTKKLEFDETDLELVSTFKNGEQSSFDKLIKKYKDRIYRIIFMIIQDKSEADDITQEVFLRAFLKINTFRAESSFFTWLYSIAINECRHALRKKKGMLISIDSVLQADDNLKLGDILKSNEESPESRLIREEQIEMLNRIINMLPDKYKTVYVLKIIDGLSYKEISEILNISIEKVKVWLFRAREKLDEKIRPLYETHGLGGNEK